MSIITNLHLTHRCLWCYIKCEETQNYNKPKDVHKSIINLGTLYANSESKTFYDNNMGPTWISGISHGFMRKLDLQIRIYTDSSTHYTNSHTKCARDKHRYTMHVHAKYLKNLIFVSEQNGYICLGRIVHAVTRNMF